jgi:hypothetical protein
MPGSSVREGPTRVPGAEIQCAYRGLRVVCPRLISLIPPGQLHLHFPTDPILLVFRDDYV